jgi:hypothetical protein
MENISTVFSLLVSTENVALSKEVQWLGKDVRHDYRAE